MIDACWCRCERDCRKPVRQGVSECGGVASKRPGDLDGRHGQARKPLHTALHRAFRRLLQIGVAFLLFSFALRIRTLAAVLALSACVSAAWALPAFDEVRQDFRPSDTLVLSREGEVLQRLRTDATVRRASPHRCVRKSACPR